MAWHGHEDVEPHQNAKDMYWQSSRHLIYILVIQDHIESIGKPILLKGDEVLLNGLLAQMLSDIAPKLSTSFSFQICPKPKVKLGPTDSIYPAPPSSYDIATARNPNSTITPIRISVSLRWPCNLSVAYCSYFDLTEMCNRSHRVFLTKSLFAYSETGHTKFTQLVSPRWGYALTLAHRSHRVDLVGPTENSKFHIFSHIGLTEFHYSVPPSLEDCV